MNLRILLTLAAFFLLTMSLIAQPGKMFIDTSAGIKSEDRMVFIGYPEDRREESTVEPDSVIKVVRISKSAFLSLSKSGRLLYSPLKDQEKRHWRTLYHDSKRNVKFQPDEHSTTVLG